MKHSQNPIKNLNGLEILENTNMKFLAGASAFINK